MNTTLALAVRNLLRNRRRSIATLLAISIGSITVLLFGGYAKNISYSMQTAYINSGGHLQIQHSSFYLYGSGNPTAYGIAGYEKIMQAIRNDAVLRDMVEVVTPTLQFGGIAGNYAAGVSRTVIGNGFVADDYAHMREWNEFQLPQTRALFALKDTPQDTAVAGVGLARVLQLCEALKISDCPPAEGNRKPKPADDAPALAADIAALSAEQAPAPKGPAASGRRIELLTTSARGAPNVGSLDVVQAESQGFKELDEVYLMLHLGQTQRLIYGKDTPRVTAVMVQLKRTSQMKAARARLESLLPEVSGGQPLSVRDFESLNPFYVQTMQLFDTLFGFMFALIGAIVLFTVGNTMNTAVVERTVEIGTLRAIGLRRSGIRSLFVVEGALLGLFGALLGLLAALAVAGAVNAMHLTWLPPGASTPVPLSLALWGQTAMLLGTAGGLIFITTVSAWWPARRAARIDIVDALRHF